MKRCAVCGRTCYHGYNGLWYCIEHDPQRICDKCGKNVEHYFPVNALRICDSCRMRLRKRVVGAAEVVEMANG